MSKKLVISAVVMIVALAVSWRPRAQGGGKETPRVFAGAAVHLVPKNGQLGYFLKEPSIIQIGEQAFIVGQPIREKNGDKDGPKRVWVPASRLEHIEEFESVQALRKFYSTD